MCICENLLEGHSRWFRWFRGIVTLPSHLRMSLASWMCSLVMLRFLFQRAGTVPIQRNMIVHGRYQRNRRRTKALCHCQVVLYAILLRLRLAQEPQL